MDFIENEHRARLVLVVDDEPSVLNFIKHILEGIGCVVLTSQNSIEALILASEYQGRIDLLLTDVQMKVHRNGMELASCIHDKDVGAMENQC